MYFITENTTKQREIQRYVPFHHDSFKEKKGGVGWEALWKYQSYRGKAMVSSDKYLIGNTSTDYSKRELMESPC